MDTGAILRADIGFCIGALLWPLTVPTVLMWDPFPCGLPVLLTVADAEMNPAAGRGAVVAEGCLGPGGQEAANSPGLQGSSGVEHQLRA